MATFIGTHRHKVDAKGRVSLPARFRDAIAKEDPEARRIVLYPTAGPLRLDGSGTKFVSDLVEKVSIPGNYSDADRVRIENLLAQLVELSFDETGRVLLSSELLAVAEIGDEAVFRGIGTSFQIFGGKRFDALMAERAQGAAAAPLGLADAQALARLPARSGS
jgi:MraZ protein